MGVTIHYRGRLNEVGQLARLCDEMADIARAMGWETTRLDDDWEQPADARLRFTSKGAQIDGHLGLKGILLKPNVDAEFLGKKIDQLSTALSSPRFGEVSGLSADEIAARIEQWFLEDGNEDPQ